MQPMREVIRGSLARSLGLLQAEDRIAAALPVVCGGALAAHCEVALLDEQGILHLRVDGSAWASTARGMRDLLLHDLQRVAGVKLAGVHFVQTGSTSDRVLRRSELPAGQQRPARVRSSGAGPFTPRGRLG